MRICLLKFFCLGQEGAHAFEDFWHLTIFSRHVLLLQVAQVPSKFIAGDNLSSKLIDVCKSIYADVPKSLRQIFVLAEFEQEDYTVASQELACVGNSCEI